MNSSRAYLISINWEVLIELFFENKHLAVATSVFSCRADSHLFSNFDDLEAIKALESYFVINKGEFFFSKKLKMNHQPTRQTRRSARRRVEPERFEPEGRQRNDHRPVPYARHRRRRQEQREQVLNAEIARVTESRHVSK
jgi:hypothetical protein